MSDTPEIQMADDHTDWEEVVKRVIEAADADLAKQLDPETAEEGPEAALGFLAELVEAARSTPDIPADEEKEQ